MSLLRHNEVNSLIRRPSGINDDDWNVMIKKSIKLTVANQTSFFYEMALFCIENKNKPIFENILKLFGISDVTKEKFMTRTNMEHFLYRGFRHFCPENFRNALNHSGMPFGRLAQVTATEFLWISEKTFNVVELTPLLESAGIEIDDNISVSASGKSDVENIVIVINGGDRIWEYYVNGVTKSFGDTMYLLKKSIIANTIKQGR